ncbi:alpha-amylase family glycosyl hydrolase [Arenibaculum pallidiluteum]|uniref:alpha-amylase family glycosyl hydrolase n=1 Tax=Arenibaculum pallidiluteum TaxID=2812559 RepID=UPI001A9715C3|nr:alpha-amylase family glycosyl hydrolase [Arenibaculum pallidiluteum]
MTIAVLRLPRALRLLPLAVLLATGTVLSAGPAPGQEPPATVSPSAGDPTAAPPVVLRGAGGDAWTFEKAVEGTARSACESVLLRSPAGTVPAWRLGERFGGEVPLAEGANPVTAVCVAGGVETASAPQTWTLRLADRPRAWVRTGVAGSVIRLDAGRSEPSPGRAAPIVEWRWAARPGNPAPLAIPDGAGPALELPTPAADGEYQVGLSVTDALGRTDEAVGTFRVAGGRPVEVDLMRERPSWTEGAVVYGVVPSLFGPRGLPDVTARLDEIAELGASVLWLAPVNSAPPGDFGYAVTDHFSLRPEAGTEEDLRTLVREAHARGMRVIMDFVPNHAADGHPYWLDAQARGPDSPYAGYFDRQQPYYFTWQNLRNLDYDQPEVRRYMLEAFTRWVREFDIDGFRVDVAWGVRERAPEFWPEWRAALKRIKPDLLLLAEASARDPHYVGNGFDAAYDWTAELGQWAWHDAFGAGVPTPRKLRAALDVPGATPVGQVMRFINNNDTGPRFVTRHGPGRTRVAAALLMTLPGLPLVYTGDEVGAEYEPYKGPRPLNWVDRHGLRAHYRRLIALRASDPALRGPGLRLAEASPDDRVLAYWRLGPAPGQERLVLLNFGDRPVRARLAADGWRGTGFRDLMNEGVVVVDPAAPAVDLPAFGIRILAPDAADQEGP